MPKLEKFVRQVEQTAAPRRIPTAPVADAGPVVLQYGLSPGSTKTYTSTESWTTTFYLEAHRNEPKKKKQFSLGGLSLGRGILDDFGSGDEPKGIYDTDRKWHMKRFFGFDPATVRRAPDGTVVADRDEDVWVDVQRIDEIVILLHPERQGYTWHPKWYDPDDRTKENPAHVMVKIKNPDDNEQFIPVPAMEDSEWGVNPYLSAKEFSKEDIDGPEEDTVNPNDKWWRGQVELLHTKLPEEGEPDELRMPNGILDIRRVIHREVKAEPDKDGFFAEGAYILVLDEDGGEEFKDKDQYINFAFPLRVTMRDTPQRLYQINHFNLKQDYLLEFFEPMDLKDARDKKKRPMWLDPFQNIINVQWGMPQALAGIYEIAFNNQSGVDTTLLLKVVKGDANWEDGFGPDTGAAASGLGRTVVGRGRKLVAFGKPRDGASGKPAEPCFISVSYEGEANEIKRGVLDDEGQLEWTVVGSVPDTAWSCSFAGGAFFISYYVESGTSNAVGLAVSFDGINFTQDIEPFAGVEDPSICNPDEGEQGSTNEPAPDPIGGSVAYDKKNNRYVTTGKFFRHYGYTYTNEINAIFTGGSFDENFMSSVSTDGLTWTPYFDQSEGWGLNNRDTLTEDSMDGRFEPPSSVCFGKGIFVAAASKKVLVDRIVPSGPSGFVLTPTYTQAASVAISTDGENWTCVRLPETLSELNELFLVDAGDMTAVIFIESGGTTEDDYPEGFFVALGSEFTNLYPNGPGPSGTGYSWQTKYWVSNDGYNWGLTRTDDDKFAWILSAISKSAKPGSASIVFI